MGRKLSDGNEEFVVRMYNENVMSMVDLAGIFGITRQGIWKALKRAEVDTGKRKLDAVCYWCEKGFKRARKKLRKAVRSFCSVDCYDAYLRELGADYIPNRHGQRIARAIVGAYFKLSEGNVVHHENKNCLDNDLRNLKVFENKSEHGRYHRIGRDFAQPIWEGSSLERFK